MKPGMKCFLAIIGLIVFLGFVAINVQAPPPPTDVWVDDDYDSSTPDWGYTRFDNIQDAVDNVSVGGTVYVYAGDYAGNVYIDKTMSLVGNTTVDAANGIYQNRTNVTYTDYGFQVDMADYVNITGFSMEFIADSLGPPWRSVWIDDANDCNISGNVIFGNDEQGIYLGDSCRTTIVNNILINCSYGIQVFGDSIDNIIEHNNISYGSTNGGSEAETYYISVKQETGWVVQQELHFSQYYTREIAALPLPDIDGDYKVRITQQGGTAAHIDYIALLDDIEVPPVSAVCLDDGSNMLLKV
ncbi:MAG: NosD domain-containing protein, partial [Thermoplasmatota archaeon]